MNKGILLVLLACLIWGLIFIIPGLLIGFSPLEVAAGRYFCFGLLSIFFMLSKGITPWRSIPKAIWRRAILYALVVNVFYYFSLVMGLRYANASSITLLSGLSPITIAFYGNWVQKECPYRQLIFPSLLIGLGLIAINVPAFTLLHTAASWEYAFGLLCGFSSLIAWNWYVVSNSQFLKQHPTLPPSHWSTLIGVSTFGWALLIAFLALCFAPARHFVKYQSLDQTLINFLLGIAVLGFMCSWVGSYLWNWANQLLPLTLAGQLTIFETVFGLIFVYLVEQRLPFLYEWLGMAAIFSGISLSMQTFRKHSLSSPFS